MQVSARIWRHFDIWLLAAVAALTIAGVAMIRSAAGGNENIAVLVPRQALWAVIGLAVVMIMAAIDYRFWSAISRPMYVFVLVFLLFVLLAGFVGFGSARWYTVGIVYIQPSEVSKFLMILIVADYLARNREEIGDLRIVLRSLLLVGVPALLVFLQPDLSTSIVLAVIWISLTWAAGIRLKHLALLAGIVLLAALIILPFIAEYFTVGYPKGQDFLFLKHYQMQRVMTFLFPDPNVQHGASYNVNQALIAIGSGGLFGQGYGHGTQVQLRFLKVRHTDFIFSAMAEEFGFAGAIVFLAIFLFIIFRCLRAARMARDTYGALICYGVALILLLQGAFNIGMNMNLFPVSGLPLPFFSYGGSSLVASLLGIGLVESVMLRHKRLEL